jgi:hypothetical protein
MSPPPTRIISWQQLVLEADPNWQKAYRSPWVYDFSNGRLFYAPTSLYSPLPASGLTNDNGLIELLDATGWASSSIGLSAGQMWTDGFSVVVQPSVTPFAIAQPIMFAGLTASQLLATDARYFPQSLPSIAGQIWNNGGLLCVS